ncbi:MAG: PP2C family protein-serine/threonine phosphatase [Phycisphaerales bacterium JB039]
MKSDHVLTFACSSALPEAPDSVLEQVVAAWPGPAPRIERTALDAWFSELLEREQSRPVGGPALVVFGPGDSRAGVRALVDRMHDLHIPGVLMLDGAEAGLADLGGAGVLVEPVDAEPRRIAAMLYALAERQRAVEQLRSEVRILSSYQSGVQTEMDRVHDELHLAAAIQRDLLPPKLPQLDGLEFGVMFRPASYVSGDFYDIVEVDGGRIAFLLADAVGHGVPAALLTMVISRVLRTHRAHFDPARAIEALNGDMVRMQRGRSRFATAVCGVIDPKTRQVTLCVAGHPAPRRRVAGGVTPRDTGGPLLGVFEGEVFESVTFTMGDGETLLLFSDGFETAFPGDESAGTEQRRLQLSAYMDELAQLPWPGGDADRSLAGAIEELGVRLDAQPGSLRPLDDLTIRSIAARPAAARRAAA